MTLTWRLLAIMIGGAALVWLVAMSIHSAGAQDEPRFVPKYHEKEWHVRAFYTDKDGTPIGLSDYGAAVFKNADDCIKALTHPDAKLVKTRTDFDAAVRQKLPGAKIGWTCAPVAVPVAETF